MSITFPTKEDLTKFYVGKDLKDVPKPAAVLDVAIIRQHCERMKRTIKALDVGFRAHVKTHKVDNQSQSHLNQYEYEYQN